MFYTVAVSVIVIGFFGGAPHLINVFHKIDYNLWKNKDEIAKYKSTLPETPKNLDTEEGRRRREEKYQRILDASLTVFSQKGFAEAKISEVAETAGVADGTIYLYFKNKDDLLISLFEAKLEYFEFGSELEPHVGLGHRAGDARQARPRTIRENSNPVQPHLAGGGGRIQFRLGLAEFQRLPTRVALRCVLDLPQDPAARDR